MESKLPIRTSGCTGGDKEICEILRATQDQFDYPKSVGCTTGKNKADVIIENVSLLRDGSLILRSAMQSMNDPTLEAIKRQNIKKSAYQDIRDDLDSKGLESQADLMLGLPLETIDTHMQGVFDLINMGVVEFSCLQTIMLKGTELDSAKNISDFGIKKSLRLIPECEGAYNVLGEETIVHEYEEIIVGTSTLTFDEYIECRKLHVIVMVYHNTRLLAMVYEFLGTLGIQKSAIIEQLYATKNQGLLDLLDDFANDTKSELIGEGVAEPDALSQLADKKSHNVIFKHLARFILENMQIVLSALDDALLDLLGAEYQKEIAEISEMLSLSVVDMARKSTRNAYQIRSIELRRIFGPRIEFVQSNRQRSVLGVLQNLFSDSEDAMAELAYRLRPSNMILKHRVAEDAMSEASPLQDMHR